MTSKMRHRNPAEMQRHWLKITMKLLRDIFGYVTIMIAALLFTQNAFGNSDKIWMRTESIEKFERDYLEEVGVPVPKMVRRYYRMNPETNKSENFETEAIYSRQGGLIEDAYVNLNARFRGDASNFSLEYEKSFGAASSARGTYWVDHAGGKILTVIEYGTDSRGTLMVKRNATKILERRVPLGH